MGSVRFKSGSQHTPSFRSLLSNKPHADFTVLYVLMYFGMCKLTPPNPILRLVSQKGSTTAFDKSTEILSGKIKVLAKTRADFQIILVIYFDLNLSFVLI